MANGLRETNVFDPDYVPPSRNEPTLLPGQRPSQVEPLPPVEPSEFGKGLRRATRQLQADVFGAVEATGQATGLESVEEFGAERAAEAQELASAVPPGEVESIFDVDSVSSFTDWAAYGLGQLTPFALSMVSTGVAGALVGGAARAATLSRGVSAADRARQVASAQKASGLTGAFAGSAVPATGAAYKDLQAEGVINPGAAALEGSIIGLLDVAPGAHLLKILGTPKRGVLRGAARGVAEQAPLEAGTEATQELVSEGFRQFLVPDHETEDLPRRLIEAASLGALGGGFAGGISGAARGALTPAEPVPLPDTGTTEPSRGFLDEDLVEETLDIADTGLPTFDTLTEGIQIPVTKTLQLTEDAKSLLGKDLRLEDPANITNQLERLNRPFLAEEQVKFERTREELAPQKVQQDLQTFRDQISELDLNETFAVIKSGQLQDLNIDLPAEVAKRVIPEKAGDVLALRELIPRIDEALARIPEAQLEGADFQPTGPFQRETLLDRTIREAKNQFPDDTELQTQFINETAINTFLEKTKFKEEERLAELLGIPEQARSPENSREIIRLRRSLDAVQRSGIPALWNSESPSSFLENFEGISAPPLNEIRAKLAEGKLDPDTQAAFTEILAQNREAGVGIAPPTDVELGKGKGGQNILFSVTKDYPLQKFPNQFSPDGGKNVINMVNLTKYARKQRQGEEQVTGVGGKPREERGAETETKRALNDALLGLSLLAEAGKIKLPEGSKGSVQAIIARGASKAPLKAEQAKEQKALNALVKLVGKDTVVDSKGRKFGELLATAGITKKFAKRKVPAGKREFDEIDFEEQKISQFVDVSREESRQLALKEVQADVKRGESLIRSAETEVAKTKEPAAKKKAQANLERLQREQKRVVREAAALEKTAQRTTVRTPVDLRESTPSWFLLPQRQAGRLKDKKEIELQGADASRSIVRQIKAVDVTAENLVEARAVSKLLDNTGLTKSQLDEMFADSETLVAFKVEVLEEPTKIPFTKPRTEVPRGEEQARKWLKDGKTRASRAIEAQPDPMPFEGLKKIENKTARKVFDQFKNRIKAPDQIFYMSPSQAVKTLQESANPEMIDQLIIGTLHGFKHTFDDGRIGIYIHPNLSEAATREILAHEIGHAVLDSFRASLDNKTANTILKEYLAWREAHEKSNVTIEQLLASKKTPKAILLALGRTPTHTPVAELAEQHQIYLLDFSEWFADGVSRWFVETRKPRTAVERFFEAIANALRRLAGISPEGTVESLMESIAGGKREWSHDFTFREAMNASKTLDIPEADQALIRRLSGRRGIGELDDKGTPEYISYVATIDTLDPYGHIMHNAFGEFLNSEVILPETRRIIERASQTSRIQNQMRNVFEHDRAALQQLSDSEKASAYMYQLWKAGLIKVGDRTDTLFNRIAKFFRDTLGIVSDSKKAAQIFDQLDQNLFPFEQSLQRSAVQRVLPDSMADTLVKNFGTSYDVIMKPMRSVFFTIDERVRNTGFPALIQLASHFHIKPGQQSSIPTMWTMKQEFRGRFENIIRRIFDGKDARFGEEALEFLYQTRPLEEAQPGVQRIVKQVRKLFRQMLQYQKDAGVDIKDFGPDYFPWVFEQKSLKDMAGQFRTMLEQNKYSKKRKDLASFVSFRQNREWMMDKYDITEADLKSAFERYANTSKWQLNDANNNPIGIPSVIYDGDSVVDYLVRNATAEMGLDIEVSEDQHVPVLRFNNPRLFKFVTPQDIRPFLSNNLGETIGMYISQAVKHAEYTRRFGENGQGLQQLLDKARAQGASDKDIKLAVNYVQASMGTYGRHTAEWLHRHLGIQLPEHQFSPINEGLNKAFGTAIVYQNLRYLGLATLTSLADVMGIAVRSSELGAVVRSIKAFRKRNQTHLKDLGEMLGITEHSQVADALGWRYDGMYLTGGLRRFNEGFFRLIGLQAWTRTTRLMGLAAAEAFIVKHATRPNKHSKRWLNELNLTADDVLLRRDGTLRVLSHAERKDATEAEIIRDDRLRNALIQFTDEAILRPNPSMRTLWGSDPHFQLFQYLKSFMYTFHERILKRVWHEAMEDNFAAFVWLLSYIPVMIVADLFREGIQFGPDGDPRKANWGFGDYVQHGAIRAGLLGYAQQGLELHSDIKFGGYGLGGFAATFDTMASVPELLTLDEGAVGKALPGQTIYREWFN